LYEKYPTAADAVGLPNPMIPITLINQLQIQKRLCGEFTEREIEGLIQIKREAMIQDDQDLLFCINVLLDKKMVASVAFKQWDREKQEFYEGLPIYKLYLDL
jgi:hypothetical protein